MIPVLWGDYPPYHDRRYDKVWAACQDLNMPVHTHVGPAPPSADYGQHLGIYTTEVRWWGARPLWFALWAGYSSVFFRNCVGGATECGAFWANDLLWLMDTRFLREHSAKKMSKLLEGDLTMPPSAYFDRNCFIGATTTERRELARRYEIGVPNILWGQRLSPPPGRNLAEHPQVAAAHLLGHPPHRRDSADAGGWPRPRSTTSTRRRSRRWCSASAPTPADLGQDDAVSIPQVGDGAPGRTALAQ